MENKPAGARSAGRSNYTYQDIQSSLTAAGLQRGDTVFVTTSLGMLGKADGVENLEQLNGMFHSALRSAVGDTGTVLVPTYSYTFGRSTASNLAVFDPVETAAEIGPFPEFFRKQGGVVRSVDPMMSVAGIGPQVRTLFAGLPPTSYGADCLFERLTLINSKCCSIGLGPNWMPFIHHADWRNGSPYRYDKVFKGIIKNGGRKKTVQWLYTVPMLHKSARATGHRLGKEACDAGLWEYAELGRARVYVANYPNYFNFVMERLSTDPWATAVGPGGDSVRLEVERVGRVEIRNKWERPGTLEATLLAMAEIRRAEVSDEAEQSLDLLDEKLELDIWRYRTGKNCFDWIVPEKWRVRQAQLTDNSGRLILQGADAAERVYTHSLSVDDVFDKNDLAKKITTDGWQRTEYPYVNVVRDRDWGFCLDKKTWQEIPSGEIQVHIQTDFSLGELCVGVLAEPNSAAPPEGLTLIVGYIDGPATGAGLDGLRAAIECYVVMRDNGMAGLRLLAIPGPCGLAAWLSDNESPDEVASVIEFTAQSDEPGKFKVAIPGEFPEHPAVRAIGYAGLVGDQLEISRAANADAYCLTPGGNPNRSALPTDRFPVISVGTGHPSQGGVSMTQLTMASLRKATQAGRTVADALCRLTD